MNISEIYDRAWDNCMAAYHNAAIRHINLNNDHIMSLRHYDRLAELAIDQAQGALNAFYAIALISKSEWDDYNDILNHERHRLVILPAGSNAERN